MRRIQSSNLDCTEEKEQWREEERIKRFKGLIEYNFAIAGLSLLRGLSLIFLDMEAEYTNFLFIVIPIIVSISLVMALLSVYILKHSQKNKWMKRLDIPFNIISSLIIMIAISGFKAINNDYIRGLSMAYIFVFILYFGIFMYRSMLYMSISFFAFTLQYIFLFPHESTELMRECLVRLLTIYALIALCAHRFLKENKDNFTLRYNLNQSNKLNHRFINSMNSNIIIYTPKGIQYQNPSSMTGVLAISGQNWVQKSEQIVRADNTSISLLDVIWKYFDNKENEGLCDDEEFKYLDPITTKVILVSVTLIECGSIKNNIALALIMKDVTHIRKVAEKAMSEKYKKLIMNSFSHEVRTPLNGILGMIQVSKERITDKETRMHLDLAESSGFFLKNQLADIEDCGQMVAGKFTLRDNNYICFSLLFEELEKAVLPQLISKSVVFKLTSPHILPDNFRGDKDRLCQILSNLLSNAIKYTSHGQISLQCKYDRNNRKIKFGVIDTGIGIPPNVQDSLFDIGGSTDSLEEINTSANIFKLSGLGLNISQMIAREMHTKIQVKSQFGKGSVFSFDLLTIQSPSTLPQLPSHCSNFVRRELIESEEGELSTERMESQAARPYVSHTQIPHDYQTKLVLIVDDMPTNRFVIRGLLQQFSTLIKMLEAENGREAIQQIKASLSIGYNNILVFMDLDMPIMNGYEAISIIRGLDQALSIKIVVVSAFTTENDRTECLKLGIQDFLPKPVSKGVIVKALYDHLLKN